MSVGRWFVAVVWCAGLATGVLLARAPGWDGLPMPVLTVPLGVALLFDVAVQTGLVRSARLVTMNERMVGVIGGAVIALVISAAARP